MKQVNLPQSETEVSRNYLKDISILEVLTNGRSEFYKVTSLSNESITLTNVDDKEDEYYLDFIDNKLIFDEIGTPMNLEDFYSDISDAFINQNVDFEKTIKRCSN